MSVDHLVTLWNRTLEGLEILYPDSRVTVAMSVVKRPNDVRILFDLKDLENSRDLGRRIDSLEYHFHATHWPGEEKARMWILAVWVLLMEHEALEFFYVNGKQFADPHTSDMCAKHRAELEKRHDMGYMINRLGLVGWDDN